MERGQAEWALCLGAWLCVGAEDARPWVFAQPLAGPTALTISIPGAKDSWSPSPQVSPQQPSFLTLSQGFGALWGKSRVSGLEGLGRLGSETRRAQGPRLTAARSRGSRHPLLLGSVTRAFSGGLSHPWALDSQGPSCAGLMRPQVRWSGGLSRPRALAWGPSIIVTV